MAKDVQTSLNHFQDCYDNCYILGSKIRFSNNCTERIDAMSRIFRNNGAIRVSNIGDKEKPLNVM